MRKFPVCESVPVADVMQTVFTLSPSRAADVCGVGISEVMAWREGSKPVPVACYRLLQLVALGVIPVGFGRWSGWRFVEDRIYAPGDPKGVRFEELLFIDHYRLNQSLVELQTETIENLTRQRDFYQRQCGLEARVGLMLANLCGNS